MPTPKLTAEILAAAIEGFEAQKRRIDGQIAELRQMLDGGRPEPASTPEPQKRKRRKMTAAGRKAISEATKNRWAAFHAAKESAEKPAVAKKVAPKKVAKKAVKRAPVKLAKKAGVKRPQKKAATAPEGTAAPAGAQ